MKNNSFTFLLFGWIAFASCDLIPPQQENTSKPNYQVVHIVDGDTYDILIDGIQTRVRMEGIDAPERGMDFYKQSKLYLGELCLNQTVVIKGEKKDRYGRLIASTYLVDGRELGQEMIKEGLAWHFKKYSSDTLLSRLEIEARNARKGLWSLDNPKAPWDYRSRK